MCWDDVIHTHSSAQVLYLYIDLVLLVMYLSAFVALTDLSLTIETFLGIYPGRPA
jgi:hypothetical protein